MNFWWIKCKIVHTVLGHIKWSAIGLYFEDPVFFFLTMLHIWWFLWFVAAVFENTRTCVRNILNQGENVFPLQGEEERIVLYVLCYYCWFYWVHCFHFLWHTKMVRVFCENGACCQLLSVQFGSLIKSFFHIQTVVESVPRQSEKKYCCQKRETTAACSWNAKRLTGTILYFISILNKWFCWCLPLVFSPLAFSFLWTFTLLSCTHTDYVTLLTSYYCQCWGSNTTHRVDSAFLVHIRMALLITAFRLREVHSCVFCCCLAHRRRAAKEMRGISLGAWIKFAMGDRCHVRTGAMCQ